MNVQANTDPVWRVTRPQNGLVVEREGVRVGTICGCDRLNWEKPELIGIVACPAAWKSLPLRVQQQIWSRLLGCLRRDHPIAHDRPEIGRLSDATFRAVMDRAVAENNSRLIEDLVADCPYWRCGRDDLLRQPSFELRRWHRLLRLPKNVNVRGGVKDFVRALRHAAGLLEATDTE
ncbi:MAG: hypothetical protein K2V38_12780 [Gemmataceae bacterium]|nr:hypothetical protein [Gemmataceae bacterium]